MGCGRISMWYSKSGSVPAFVLFLNYQDKYVSKWINSLKFRYLLMKPYYITYSTESISAKMVIPYWQDPTRRKVPGKIKTNIYIFSQLALSWPFWIWFWILSLLGSERRKSGSEYSGNWAVPDRTGTGKKTLEIRSLTWLVKTWLQFGGLNSTYLDAWVFFTSIFFVYHY